MIPDYSPTLKALERAINGVVLGKPKVVLHTLTAVLAGGHILFEDVPGVGKTTLARATAQVLGCSFKRIQFTSDLLPSDILGVNIYSQSSERFEFRPGPIFAHVVLADEINRTTPKTQSSLLQAMNAGQISVDNQTLALPDPFLVIATQNPQDFHGTYPLPESQLDRFMMRLEIGYPAPSVEREVLKSGGHSGTGLIEGLPAITDPESLRALRTVVEAQRIDDLVLDYLLGLVAQTRSCPQLELGVSTRGALALKRAAQARSLLLGRSYVLPDDVKALAVPVLAHRVLTAGVGAGFGTAQGRASRVIADLVQRHPVPI